MHASVCCTAAYSTNKSHAQTLDAYASDYADFATDNANLAALIKVGLCTSFAECIAWICRGRWYFELWLDAAGRL